MPLKIDICIVMSKKTIGEFVENRDIYLKIMELGVDYAQGFGVGKITPLADLDSMHQNDTQVRLRLVK